MSGSQFDGHRLDARDAAFVAEVLPAMALLSRYYHPSAILRAANPELRARLRAELLEDLRLLKSNESTS